MKCILFTLLIGSVFLGCGPRFAQEGCRIRVEFRNQTVREYRLLAVRETSLLVGPESHAESIPIDLIRRVFAENNAKTTWAIAGGVLGLAGLTFIYGITSTNEGENPGQALIFGNKILWVWACILAGAGVGYFFADDEDEFDPSNPEHLKELREVSAYPFGEPPELYNVR